MLVTTPNPSRPSWQEIGRLAQEVGLPKTDYRATEGDSVLDKSASIQLFQKLFNELLVESEQVSLSTNPGQVLTQKLLSTFRELFPELGQDIKKLPEALLTIGFVSHPKDRALSSATQDLQRLALSSLKTVIEEILSYSVPKAELISKLRRGSFETEGASLILSNSLRLAALRGLSDTLVHSGEIGAGFKTVLLSQFGSEPYHALSALYSLAQVNVSRKDNDLSSFKITSLSNNKEQLLDAMNQRFQYLKPQVHKLLDDVLTVVAQEALKKQIKNSGTKSDMVAKRLASFNDDPISCLNFESSQPLPVELAKVRELVVTEVGQRVDGEMLRLTLSAWGAMPSESDDERSVDLIDVVLEIRKQQAS